jgi:hypothetical protein
MPLPWSCCALMAGALGSSCVMFGWCEVRREVWGGQCSHHPLDLAHNVIECTFGVLKEHFKILLLPPAYSMDIQAWIIAALCALHNFIREHESNDDDQTINQDCTAGIKAMMTPMTMTYPTTHSYHLLVCLILLYMSHNFFVLILYAKMLLYHKQQDKTSISITIHCRQECTTRSVNVQHHQSPNPRLNVIILSLFQHHWGWDCKGNLTDLRRILHLSLAKGNPK